MLVRHTCNTVSAAIKKTDDSEGFVGELLAACWREDADGTAKALLAFAAANQIARI